MRATWLVLCLLLVACATVGPAPNQTKAVSEGTKVAVLLRFDGEDHSGRPLKPLVSDAMHTPFGFVMGDNDSGGVPTYETLRAGKVLVQVRYASWVLSSESENEGWLTLFLQPGYYYLGLGIKYCGWCGTSDLGLEFVPGSPVWRLEVPSGTPVIYAGTFHLSGETTWDIGGRYFSGLDQQATQIRDESHLAAQVARRDLPSLPAPVTRLIKRHSGPYLLGIPPAAPL